MEITYLNDPLLHNEENKYFIKGIPNIYRSLVFPTEFDTKDWARKTPYLVSQDLSNQLKKVLNDQNLMERLIRLIEKYTICKYVKNYSIPRWLLRQVERGLINIVVLRCISILLSQNSKQNEKFFSVFLNKTNYFTDYMHRTILKTPLKSINLFDDVNIYLAGCIVGDGYVGIKDQHVSISDGHPQKKLLNYSKEYLEWLGEIIKNKFGLSSTIRKKKAENTYELIITSKWFGRFYHNMFDIPLGNKYDKLKQSVTN